jgi:hypothetical protein
MSRSQFYEIWLDVHQWASGVPTPQIFADAWKAVAGGGTASPYRKFRDQGKGAWRLCGEGSSGGSESTAIYLQARGTLSEVVEHCSRFVAVACSERVKTGTNGSSRAGCRLLRNQAKSKIFKTRQNSRLFS